MKKGNIYRITCIRLILLEDFGDAPHARWGWIATADALGRGLGGQATLAFQPGGTDSTQARSAV